MSQPQPGETLQLVAGELHAIGQRLTYLGTMVQAQMQVSPQPFPAQQFQAAPEQQPAASQQSPAMPGQQHATAPESASQQPYPGLSPYPHTEGPTAPHRRFGSDLEPSRILAWVGAGVTLLGVVFLLVLAVQQDWLGPDARVAGGAVLAALLIAAGWWMHHRFAAEQSGGAGRIAVFALATTGFGALFLDVVAATALYDFLSVPTGLGTGFAVSVAGLALADRWRAQPLAIGVALSSAICAPMITRAADAVLLGFLLLLQVAAAPAQVRRGWPGLALAAGIPTVLAAFMASAVGAWVYDPALPIAIFAAAVLGVILAAITAGARPDADWTAIGLLIAAPIPAFLAGPLMLERPAAGTIGAGMVVLLLGIWGAGRFTPAFRGRLSARFVVAVGGMAAVAAVQTTLTFLDSSSWATALLCEALLLSVGGFLLRSPGVLLGATCYAIFGFLLTFFNELPIRALLWYGGGIGIRGLLAGLLIALVAIGLPIAGVRIGKLAKLPGSLPLWFASGVALLYGTASATMAACLLLVDARAGFLTGHILITLSWVVAAIALLLRGVRAKHLRIAGLVLIAVSLAKLLLFDLATLDGFARVIAFLCAGLILLAAGSAYARLLARAKPTP
ncbi:DUF2339 domain-containing protein [Saccharopolyspora phatthalungensis]|uniref:Putative membrane protein n=1 Tax=Saccharopolyspora phatthalungensis TaxID=664693 RepID=A0A840Q5G6_9PSEU|nr:DUF2339 domain-containing protein [Saccharopolyspora phatthalungensis]MBB5155120.1 putative membrane protein [Saccharopolyspora phatthalungensis]